jgi:Asp-tRNA(Asn)/Glu-tRNA(Gln) amidotransferase A subunit family amidase
MGRSVEDVALLVDAIQGYDARDAASIAMSRARILATATAPSPKPPRFAFVKTSAWGSADPATHHAFGALVDRLGASVREISIDPTFEAGTRAAQTVQDVEMAASYGPILDRAPGVLSTGLTAGIERGRRVPGIAYIDALNARARYAAALEEIFRDHAAILTPAAPGIAPKGLARTGDPVFCGFWTYLGLPAVTLPLLEADAMPMGVQLVGAHRDDGRLLAVARWLAAQEAERRRR